MDRQKFFEEGTPFNKQKNGGNDDGPKVPDVKRPDGKNLLERMKRVDPNAAKRYRQRAGQ